VLEDNALEDDAPASSPSWEASAIPPKLFSSPFAAASPEKALLSHQQTGCACTLAASHPAAWHREGAAPARAAGRRAASSPAAPRPPSTANPLFPQRRSQPGSLQHPPALSHPPRAGSCQVHLPEPVLQSLAAPKAAADTRMDTLPASSIPGDAQQHVFQPWSGQHHLLGPSRHPPTSAGSLGCCSESRGEAGDPACPAFACRPVTGKCTSPSEHRQLGATELQQEQAKLHVGLRTKQEAPI